MGDVVDINENKPHITGSVRCIECHYEWVAVVAEADWQKFPWLECPKCKLEKGRFHGHFLPDDRNCFHCNCGNELFYATRQGVFCPSCGAWPDPWKTGPSAA